MLVLTRCPSGNHFLDDVAQLRCRNDHGYSDLGVHPGTWAPGSKCLVEEQPQETWNNTPTFLIENHQLSGYAESPSLLFLLNGKCLWLSQVPTCTVTEDASAGRNGSLMLGSSLDSRARWTQEAFRSSSDVVLMPCWQLAAVWALYHCCHYCKEGKPSEAAFCWNIEMPSLWTSWTSKLQHGLGKILVPGS